MQHFSEVMPKIPKTASVRKYCTRAQSFFLILFGFWFCWFFFFNSWRDDWKRVNSARNLTTGKVTLISKMFQMNLNCLEKYKQIRRQKPLQGLCLNNQTWPVQHSSTSNSIVDSKSGAGVFKTKENKPKNFFT